MNKDLSFVVENNKLNVRVAVFVEHKNKVLLEINPSVDFLNMPGGRVKFNESSLEAMLREIKEELGLNLKETDIKLLNTSENFFEFAGVRYNEILYVYLYKCNNKQLLAKQDFINLDNKNETFHWFSKNELKNLNCKPEIIYDLINRKSDELTHTINKKY